MQRDLDAGERGSIMTSKYEDGFIGAEEFDTPNCKCSGTGRKGHSVARGHQLPERLLIRLKPTLFFRQSALKGCGRAQSAKIYQLGGDIKRRWDGVLRCFKQGQFSLSLHRNERTVLYYCCPTPTAHPPTKLHWCFQRLSRCLGIDRQCWKSKHQRRL